MRNPHWNVLTAMDAEALDVGPAWGALMPELERIDLLLQRRYHRIHSEDPVPFPGHFLLAPERVESRIAEPHGVPHWWESDDPTPPVPPPGAMHRLASNFELNEFEWNVLLLALMVHVDSRYHFLFSDIQDSERQKRLPTIELALSLFCDTPAERLARQSSLSADGSLIRHGLVRWMDRPGQSSDGWTQCTLLTDIGVYHYLLGHPYAPPFELGIEKVSCIEIEHVPSVCSVVEQIEAWIEMPRLDIHPVAVLRAAPGAGAERLVSQIAAQYGMDTYALDCETLSRAGTQGLSACRSLFRDIRLREACLVIQGLTSATTDDGRDLQALIVKLLEQRGLQVVCLIDAHASPPKLADVPQLHFDLPIMTRGERAANLYALVPPDATVDCEALSQRFGFSAYDLPVIAREADLYRRRRGALHMDHEDMLKALQLRAQQDFGKLARRISPRRGYADLVVADSVLGQMTDIISAARFRDDVLDMGFGAKIGYGTGISALFYGDSGTGKTMAAEVLAGQLGVDLIRADLSVVVNKYIGETEKHLAKIFDLAERDAGVLFFDEADALFGKRSETKDAQDRHANIEVSYLLQRLENYPGLVILATNNRSHLDDAFSRRFTFIVRFPYPDAILRERMWRAIWPPGVGVDPEVDFTSMAERIPLTGANIRNVALLATWLAQAAGDSSIRQRHLDLAVKRELAKTGRILFEPH
ncbi:ATP-binding protein [Pararobbsia silviterrae]|uniref:ATP-binding protein n=1 Tax=Pararobbsia silviterrae TaxID=1792498 RepID=A0A494Y6N2_9BURK|nr:AAA family ATPase [Pararobbsia silviterrae]RKP55976.1 ATP-binding protein [Pararobbsia silviterrae]